MKVNVAPVYPYKFGQTTDNPVKNNSQIENFEPINNNSKNRVSSIILATALAATTITGGIFAHKTYKLKDAVKTLENNNSKLEIANKTLNESIKKIKTQLENIFEGDTKDINSKLYEEFKTAINKDLDYDASTPPITGKMKKGAKKFEDAIDFPEDIPPTNNRENIKEFNYNINKFDEAIELPITKEVKITKAESSNFDARKNQLTNISTNYADSVQWSPDKIARDLLQNFFDGHGQTLDGVKITTTPTSKDRVYKIRIEGKSTYTPEKAIMIGESTKRNDPLAAGNYGEGLKMATLKILKNYHAENVKIGSDNWEVTYKLLNDKLCQNNKVLGYDLRKVKENYDGNYIEFEIDNIPLIKAIRKGVKNFYSSYNSDFKCPDFENEYFGIKLHKKKQKGGLYIAGQKFEFDNSFDGIPGATLFLKQKPGPEILDISRDRTSLNTNNLKNIMQDLFNKISTKEDKAKFIKLMEPLWSKFGETPMDEAFSRILSFNRYGSELHLNFPEKYLAYSNCSNDVLNELITNGFEICKNDFADMGMKTIEDYYGKASIHTALIPNKTEKTKIAIIREAIKLFAKNLEKNKHFNSDELKTNIYLMDTKNEQCTYSETLAEAIIDFSKSKGFWIDKEYLNKCTFGDALETALHELSHKAGGDETSVFSYKLTNVNKEVLDQISEDPKTRASLKILKELWDETT